MHSRRANTHCLGEEYFPTTCYVEDYGPRLQPQDCGQRVIAIFVIYEYCECIILHADSTHSLAIFPRRAGRQSMRQPGTLTPAPVARPRRA